MARRLPLIFAALCLVAAMATGEAAAAGGALIAPARVCPGQRDPRADASSQQQTMSCMVNFARSQSGLNELLETPALSESASDKSADVLGCDSFSHYACGREFTYWMKETGYMSSRCWRLGENLAWGTGGYGSVRSILIAWLRSPEHRANILGDFEETGLSLRVGDLEGHPGAHVWAQHFGSHCDATGTQS